MPPFIADYATGVRPKTLAILALVIAIAVGGCVAPSGTWRRFEERTFAFRAPPGFHRVPIEVTKEEAKSNEENGWLRSEYEDAQAQMRLGFRVFTGPLPEIGTGVAITPVRVFGREGLLTAPLWPWMHVFTNRSWQSTLTVSLPPRRPGGSGRCFVATVTYRNLLDEGAGLTILRSVSWRPEAFTRGK